MEKSKTTEEIDIVKQLFYKYKEYIVVIVRIISKFDKTWTQMSSELGTGVKKIILAYKQFWSSYTTVKVVKICNVKRKACPITLAIACSRSLILGIFYRTQNIRYTLESQSKTYSCTAFSEIYNRFSRKRTYCVFGKKVWSHIIDDKINLVLKNNSIRCVLMFTCAKMFPTNSNIFASIHASNVILQL